MPDPAEPDRPSLTGRPAGRAGTGATGSSRRSGTRRRGQVVVGRAARRARLRRRRAGAGQRPGRQLRRRPPERPDRADQHARRSPPTAPRPRSPTSQRTRDYAARTTPRLEPDRADASPGERADDARHPRRHGAGRRARASGSPSRRSPASSAPTSCSTASRSSATPAPRRSRSTTRCGWSRRPGIEDAADGGLLVDGQPVRAPYVIDVIGDPHTLGHRARTSTAGSSRTCEEVGGTVDIKRARSTSRSPSTRRPAQPTLRRAGRRRSSAAARPQPQTRPTEETPCIPRT